jgi:nucleoid DNA-binding protein
MKKINASQLIDEWGAKTGQVSAMAKRNYHALTTLITEYLQKGDSVQLSGFGTFSVKEMKATIRRNPRNSELVELPAWKKPKFVAGSTFKEAIKN